LTSLLSTETGADRGRGDRGRRVDDLPPLSPWTVLIVLATSALLGLVSNRYGYHRDELYFLEAGKHLAWGYPDLPPLVPLVARTLSALAPGSLVVLRLPSAVSGGVVVFVTALMVRELQGGRAAQALGAATVAASGLLLGTEHYLNTSGFDLLVWTTLLWLVLRLLRTRNERLWLPIGGLVSVGLLNSDLVVALVACLVLALAILGPRQLLASGWALMGGLIAVAVWTPYLVWQAHHGWPQLEVSRSIASGSSGTSTPRYLLIPSQLVLVSPYLAPVWIVGLVRLLRDPVLGWCRSIGWSYLLLAGVFLTLGGKSYYLANMLPVLVSAGAQPSIDWLHRGRTQVRKALLAVALSVTVVTTVLVTLPVLPAGALHRTPIVALNYDEGETVGWPTYVGQIAAAYRQIPVRRRTQAAILASNYGEAGAIDRFGPALGLPSAFSGQDGFWYWGPPSGHLRTFLVIGFSTETIEHIFRHCRVAIHLRNRQSVKNQEQGVPVRVCGPLRSSWTTLWPRLRDLG
jgi:hypothetical protein